MEFLKNFINEYGTAILYALLTALAGYLGVWVKQLYTKYINDKTKQSVAKTVVQAVEQLYYNLNGEEKLEKALESASDMLAEKGINITDLELRMLIEAAVSEFNDAFHREKKAEGLADDINQLDSVDSECYEKADISDFADDYDDAYESVTATEEASTEPLTDGTSVTK